jgi:hypothetical protein
VSIYRHTQPGTATLIALLGGAAVVVVAGSRTGWHPVVSIVLFIIAISAVMFSSLTVEVGDGRLVCFFGVGLIRKSFPLAEVLTARHVRNRWYYGWGVRMTPSGWMFNVSGLDAVEVELASGKRFRIGTDQPQELLRAIEHSRAMAI